MKAFCERHGFGEIDTSEAIDLFEPIVRQADLDGFNNGVSIGLQVIKSHDQPVMQGEVLNAIQADSDFFSFLKKEGIYDSCIDENEPVAQRVSHG